MRRDEESQITTSIPAAPSKKNGYKLKLWALGSILLLAFWSMFTGSVTLKFSVLNNLKHSSDGLDSGLLADVDILDVEEREKMVRQMWDVYTHSSKTRLPSFWQEAFAAAYQHMSSELAGVQNAAVSEIAKMSFRFRDIYEPPPPSLPVQLSISRALVDGAKSRKQAAKTETSNN